MLGLLHTSNKKWYNGLSSNGNSGRQGYSPVKVKSTTPHEECWSGAHLPYLGLEPVGG